MQQIFYDMVKEMSAEGRTIFVSSHNLTEVQKICDRAAFIREGQLEAIENIGSGRDMSLHHYRIVFARGPDLDGLRSIKGVKNVKIDGDAVELVLTESVNPLIKYLAKIDVKTFEEQETTLEEMFMHYYKESK